MSVEPTRGPDPGLCASCRYHRIVESRRGSRFHLCTRSKEDRHYPKYPSLPVLRCAGHEKAPDPGSSLP